MSLNTDLSDLFHTLAALMDLKGESAFKAIAFSKVSRLLKDMTLDLEECCREGKLKDIEGIGPSSQRIIEQYIKTGRSEDFEEVAASVPAGLIPMLDIPSLGPKTIALLWKQRKITSLEELMAAIDQGKLDGLKGIGEKKIEAIKQGIALRSQASHRIGIVEALDAGGAMLKALRELPSVSHAEFAGSLRRRRETIGDVDLVCALKNPAAGESVSAAFVKFPLVERVLAQGSTKASVLVTRGLQVDLRIVPAENFGAALQYFTGSKDHNTRLRGLALDKKMTLNEWGLYRLDDYDRSEKKPGFPPKAKPLAGKTEEDIYKALGLAWMEPVLREDRGEIDAARAGKLPRLIRLEDIRGDLHCHTVASDGQATIEQMAQAAQARGYEFLAITDHSKTQVIANGLSAERLLKHIKEIHRVSEQIKGITLLAGCEVDILADGRLDFEDAILAELDFVVASPHLALKQDPAKATDRILRAIENRYVNVIGHPTGRIIFGREGLPLNFPRIFKAAADTATALEINAAFPRLDLNDVNARGALAAGVKLSINTDAHSVGGFGEMQHGISVAQRAWATAGDVINCMTLAQLKTFIRRKRK
ncbi:MAG TPA: DNA polymerase/3'-5' exonuclease PolX [Tepidisphaeraceae bacterium]|jgi:DNA polymerase (family 10)|nr:DNA polymerase/3'-5' exonuclease PolX [Tepidisphaeraceae bacterium]